MNKKEELLVKELRRWDKIAAINGPRSVYVEEAKKIIALLKPLSSRGRSA